MSVALPLAGIGELSSSPVESAAFGFGVARLSIGGAWASEVADADELARIVAERLAAATEDTVIVRFPSELVEVSRLEWAGGRRLQHAGTLLYWEDPLSDHATLRVGLEAVVIGGGSKPPAEFVRSAIAVVADSFDGYVNHYSYNVRIPPATVRDGYIDWTRRTIADPAGAAILLSDGEGPIAAATLRFHDGGTTMVGEVELASVASARQGAGSYKDLWMAIRKAARDAGADRLVISTQASNIRVQRAWARLGLVPLASFETVHAASVGVV